MAKQNNKATPARRPRKKAEPKGLKAIMENNEADTNVGNYQPVTPVIRTLQLWPGREPQEDGSIILTRPQLQVYHINIGYVNPQQLNARLTHCNLCGGSFAEYQDETTSLAFTNAGNEIICNPCARQLQELGVSANTFTIEAEEGQGHE